ncbi:MAG TPA: hypothetical protein VFG74_05105 [Miltoncostaeaceae bacterium]|nr:hypothetical protein [Miltoncostaeaceae bacterium]
MSARRAAAPLLATAAVAAAALVGLAAGGGHHGGSPLPVAVALAGLAAAALWMDRRASAASPLRRAAGLAGVAVLAGLVLWTPGPLLDGVPFHMVQHGLVAVLAAPLVAAALPAVSPRPVPAWAAWALFVGGNWVAHAPAVIGWAEGGTTRHLTLHAALLGASLPFWSAALAAPAGLGRGVRAAMVVAALPALDAIALWYAMLGQATAAAAMLAAMLPLPPVAVALAWAWVRGEEADARRAEGAVAGAVR